MEYKLTLRLDLGIIVKAKSFAKKKGTSLSQIVEDHFRELVSTEREDFGKKVQSLIAVISNKEIQYKEFARNKYLNER
ncbi:MAG: DUF6364 family protein [Leptospiraceae bacterium]|nr:DUF6364 family protein [Leptospiraceae bacterium]